MEVVQIWQIILHGLTTGLIYALIASGLALVFGIMRIVNFAHGEFYMLGAFGIYYFNDQFGIDYWVSLILVTLLLAGLGVVTERFVFRPFRARELHLLGLICSVGLILFFEGLVLLTAGGVEKNVARAVPGSINLFGVALSGQKLIIILVSAFLSLALYYFVSRTRIGQAMVAISQDDEAAALQGISIMKCRSLAFGICCALAGIAGGLMAPEIVLNPMIGTPAILKAFIVVVLGGLGSIQGAILGGLLLGFLESFGTYFIGHWIGIVSFLMLIVILLIRPTGLLGHE